jgi:hypothetical protein
MNNLGLLSKPIPHVQAVAPAAAAAGSRAGVVSVWSRRGSVDHTMTARKTMIVIGIVAGVIILVLLIWAQTSATSGG